MSGQYLLTSLRAKVIYCLPCCFGILYFAPGTASNVTVFVDHINGLCQVNFPLMHIVKHLLGAFCPGILIPAVPEQPHRNYYIALQGQFLLDTQKIILESCAATQCYNRVITFFHNINIGLCHLIYRGRSSKHNASMISFMPETFDNITTPVCSSTFTAMEEENQPVTPICK